MIICLRVTSCFLREYRNPQRGSFLTVLFGKGDGLDEDVAFLEFFREGLIKWCDLLLYILNASKY